MANDVDVEPRRGISAQKLASRMYCSTREAGRRDWNACAGRREASSAPVQLRGKEGKRRQKEKGKSEARQSQGKGETARPKKKRKNSMAKKKKKKERLKCRMT